MAFTKTLLAAAFIAVAGSAAAQEQPPAFNLSAEEMQTLRERKYLNDCIKAEESAVLAERSKWEEEVAGMKAAQQNVAYLMAMEFVEKAYAPTVQGFKDVGAITEQQANALLNGRINQETVRIAQELDQAAEYPEEAPEDALAFCIEHMIVDKGVDMETLTTRWDSINTNHGFDALNAPVTEPWVYTPVARPPEPQN